MTAPHQQRQNKIYASPGIHEYRAKCTQGSVCVHTAKHVQENMSVYASAYLKEKSSNEKIK